MKQSVSKTLKKAKKLSKSGDFALAEKLYRSILIKFPKNKQASEELETIALQQQETFTACTPPQAKIDTLITLFEDKKYQQVIEETSALILYFPQAPNLYNILGAANNALGWHEAACRSYRRALKIKPNDALIHNNLGNALRKNGNLGAAIESFKAALAIRPTFADAFNNLGLAQFESGNIRVAIENYNHAIQLKPDCFKTHFNLGIAHRDNGDLKEAMSSCLRALEQHPDSANTYNLLGMIERQNGNYPAAIERYRKALSITPNDAFIHHNLGNALVELGKFREGVVSIEKALSYQPNNMDFWQSLTTPISKLHIDKYTEDYANTFSNILDRRTLVRPSDIAPQILRILKLHPALKNAHNAIQLGNNKDVIEQICSDLARIPLFLKIIEICPIPDLDIEFLLKKVRKGILFKVASGEILTDITKFQCSLALHCFTNEYIFGTSKEENDAVTVLEREIEHSLSISLKVTSSTIACLASYRPLHEYAWAKNINYNDELRILFKRQVQNVLEEASIRKEIPSVKKIDDNVSSIVREQYEEHPYPRWIQTKLFSKPSSIPTLTNILNLKLNRNPPTSQECPDILIAGCGTGQHALSSASRYTNSSILAVDLSLSSLSYAIRQTQDLSVSNIEYLQADILDLDKLGRQFDIIESSGVLHHMNDPIAGWKILSKCLKSGGLMAIGLYSELARQNILAAREKISKLGLKNNKNDMLQFREILMSTEDRSLQLLLNYRDCYSLSAYRDLLFHVQEHHFTLPQIKHTLNELELTFCNFEFFDNSVFQKFKLAHPNPDAVYDLDAWTQFEYNNPNTFTGMYQFWAQKK